MNRWVFFDVGNVIFNDDPQAFYGYHLLSEELARLDPQHRFVDLLAEREKHASEGKQWILFTLAKQLLGEAGSKQLIERLKADLDERYDQHHLINAGLFEAIAALKKNYRLGIIANQTTECRRSLERRGLLNEFEVVAISDELNTSKPDLDIFKWALKEAGAEARDCVMIGDRLDNDVAPAKSLGFKTVWLAWPPSSGKSWRPDAERARAFLDSCDRVAIFPRDTRAICPDAQVASLEEIPAAVDGLWRERGR